MDERMLKRGRLKRRVSPSKAAAKDGGGGCDDCSEELNGKRIRQMNENYSQESDSIQSSVSHLSTACKDSGVLDGATVQSAEFAGVDVDNSVESCVAKTMYNTSMAKTLSEETKCAVAVDSIQVNSSELFLVKPANDFREMESLNRLNVINSVITDEKQIGLTTDDGVNSFCEVCKKNISRYNEQRRLQHINRCIDELETAKKMQKISEESKEKIVNQVLDCPICGKRLKTQNARRVHLKKCATTFSISPVALMEVVKNQTNEQQLKSDSSNNIKEELQTDILRTSVAVPAVKRKRKTRNRLEEPQSKLEEDTHLALALSTSMEDRRSSLLDFRSCLLPSETEQRKTVEKAKVDLVASLLTSDQPPSRDAFSLLMSQMAKPSVPPTKRGKKNKANKQIVPLLALDQAEVKRRMAEKAAALVLYKENFLNFHDEHSFVLPSLPKSKLSTKYRHKSQHLSCNTECFLWQLAGGNQQNSDVYYVEKLVPPIVISEHQQKTSDEQLKHVDRMSSSVLYGSTQTAFVLAELAAEAGDDSSFCDELSQKSVSSENHLSEATQLHDEGDTSKRGFCTSAVTEASVDLLCAWNEMVDNPDMSDLSFKCFDGEIIHVHKLVIKVRHSYLLQLVDSGQLKDIIRNFRKIAVLPVFRFLYCADTDIPHSVIFESLKLAQSLQLNEFCRICQNIIKNFDLVDSALKNSTAENVVCVENTRTELEESELSIGDISNSEKVVKEVIEDDDLNEVYEFALTQRQDHFHRRNSAEEEAAGADLFETSSDIGGNKSSAVECGESTCTGSSSDECDDETVGINCRRGKRPKLKSEHSDVTEMISSENQLLIFDCKEQVCDLPSGGDAMVVESTLEPLIGDIKLDSLSKLMEAASNACISSSQRAQELNSGCSSGVAALALQLDGKKYYANGSNSAEISKFVLNSEISRFSGDNKFRRVSQSGDDQVGTITGENVTSSRGDTPGLHCTSPASESASSLADSSPFNDPELIEPQDDAIIESSFLNKSGVCSPDLFPSSPEQFSCSLSQMSTKKSCDHSEQGILNMKDSLIDDESDVAVMKSPLYCNSSDGVRGSENHCGPALVNFSSVKSATDIIDRNNLFRRFSSQFSNTDFKKTDFLFERLCVSQSNKMLDDEFLPDLDHLESRRTNISYGNISGETSMFNAVQNESILVEEKPDEISKEICSSPDVSKCLRSTMSCSRMNTSEGVESAVSQKRDSDSDGCVQPMIHASSVFDGEVIMLESDVEGVDDVESGQNDDGKENIHDLEPMHANESSPVSATNEHLSDLWENFPEENQFTDVFFPEDGCTSKSVFITPKTPAPQVLSKIPSPVVIFSPLTDVDTDVSALLDDVANSSLLNSDMSFEMAKPPPAKTKNAREIDAATGAKNAMNSLDRTPVTPMPSYGEMNTPSLQNRCHDFGVRRLPKRQMVKVLQNIYYELHPGVQKDEDCKKQTKTKPTKKQNRTTGPQRTLMSSLNSLGHLDMKKQPIQSSQKRFTDLTKENGSCDDPPQKSTDSESDWEEEYVGAKVPKDGSESEKEDSIDRIPEESIVFVPKTKKTKTHCQTKLDDNAKKQMLWNFFSKNDELYQKVLNYEPLEFDFLKKILIANGIKIASNLLMDFMDEQNILFTTRNSQTGWNNRRGGGGGGSTKGKEASDTKI